MTFDVKVKNVISKPIVFKLNNLFIVLSVKRLMQQ